MFPSGDMPICVNKPQASAGVGSLGCVSRFAEGRSKGIARLPGGFWIWGIVSLLTLAAGCSKPSMPLHVKVVDPPPARNLRCQFTRAYYQPAECETMTMALVGTGEKGGAPSRETLVLEMMWRTNPGATWSDPSGTNVKITYVVDLAGSSLIFDGAGFLRVWENKEKTELLGEIQSSSLHLRSHPGVLDPTMKIVSIAGSFRASKNPSQTVENMLKVKQYLNLKEGSLTGQ